jgi:hypothetical protein
VPRKPKALVVMDNQLQTGCDGVVFQCWAKVYFDEVTGKKGEIV